MFQINEVLTLEGELYRILKIIGDQVVWIPVEDKLAYPSVETLSVINQLVLDEKVVRAEDPYAFLQIEAPNIGSKATEIRDNYFRILKPLIEEPFFYLPKVRTKVLNEILKTEKISKPYLYRIARQFWQRGQIPNALLPDYRNSGAKGKRRIAKDLKLGRPRVHTEGIGALIDEFTEKLFRIVIDKYLLKENQVSLPFVHRQLKLLYDQYFPNTPESEKPTKWQLQYFYNREYGFTEKIIKKTSDITYKKDVRPLTGTATMHALGPGSRFEIDATIADIYLVSDVDRTQPVGRPILYIVVDVFSRFVVGWYIGFENPSYVAAIQSLYLAMTDKNALIKSLGIECQDLDWPTPGLPEAILADRGEILGHQIEGLESSFLVRIENTPPYRGDAKGIVERNFRSLQDEFKPFAPGVVTGSIVKKRGGNDYRLDGKLTVSQFKEIIISSIIMHNFVDTIEKYDRSEDMPVNLPCVPVHLWNWGLQNRTGRLRKADAKSLRIALLPREQATTSEKGICLFGLYYSSAEVIAAGWMHRTKFSNRPEKVTVAYDPNVADEVYLLHKPNSREFWVCRLSNISREYRGRSFWEVWSKQDANKKLVQKDKLNSDKTRAQHEERILRIIKSAEKEAPVATSPKSERLANIGKSRAQELELERDGNRPSQTKHSKSADVIFLPNASDENTDYPLYLDELFNDEDE
jgi:transposase InsO family protein